MNMGIYRLNGVLDAQCPMLFHWATPVSEPYHVRGLRRRVVRRRTRGSTWGGTITDGKTPADG